LRADPTRDALAVIPLPPAVSAGELRCEIVFC
jgi:hypothetical protein